jgi:hypothetical protein
MSGNLPSLLEGRHCANRLPSLNVIEMLRVPMPEVGGGKSGQRNLNYPNSPNFAPRAYVFHNQGICAHKGDHHSGGFFLETCVQEVFLSGSF